MKFWVYFNTQPTQIPVSCIIRNIHKRTLLVHTETPHHFASCGRFLNCYDKRSLSWARWVQSTPSHPIPYDPLQYYPPIYTACIHFVGPGGHFTGTMRISLVHTCPRSSALFLYKLGSYRWMYSPSRDTHHLSNWFTKSVPEKWSNL
jgi:hypothetical protein